MGQWSEIDQRGPVGPVEKSATCRAFRMKDFRPHGHPADLRPGTERGLNEMGHIDPYWTCIPPTSSWKMGEKFRKLWSIKFRGSPFSERSSLDLPIVVAIVCHIYMIGRNAWQGDRLIARWGGLQLGSNISAHNLPRDVLIGWRAFSKF